MSNKAQIVKNFMWECKQAGLDNGNVADAISVLVATFFGHVAKQNGKDRKDAENSIDIFTEVAKGRLNFPRHIQ